jgi:hypothetical protein
MATARINGRLKFFDCDSIAITEVSSGRFEVTYDDERTFTVLGGRKSGGAAHEWFCHHPLFYGDAWLPKNSMVEAIKAGVQY